MAYDERLAERIRALLAARGSFEERQMFGGIAFMVNGRMACGVLKQDLVAHVAREDHDKALARPHARLMDFTHRPMKGFLYVAPPGVKTTVSLRSWVNQCADYAESQPRQAARRTGGRAVSQTARKATKPKGVSR